MESAALTQLEAELAAYREIRQRFNGVPLTRQQLAEAAAAEKKVMDGIEACFSEGISRETIQAILGECAYMAEAQMSFSMYCEA